MVHTMVRPILSSSGVYRLLFYGESRNNFANIHTPSQSALNRYFIELADLTHSPFISKIPFLALCDGVILPKPERDSDAIS